MSSSPFHHYAFNHGAKKVVPLKIRNPSIHPSHIMPSPSSAPFNMADMPWSYSGGAGGGIGKPGQVMEFNAVIRPGPLIAPGGYQPFPAGGGSAAATLLQNELRKRKTEPDVIPIPSKQFLTEDVMASHLSNLHLSSEYTSHNIETLSVGEENLLVSSTLDSSGSLSPCSSSLQDDDMFGAASSSSSSTNHTVYMSPQELEERLKKAQRISVCEEVRKLENRTDILPQLLLDRMEKPCKALILWQPPPTLDKLVTNVSKVLEEKEQEEERIRKSNEMMLGEDEPLPDLPDYDDDLDFEENNNNVATVGDLNSMDVEN